MNTTEIAAMLRQVKYDLSVTQTRVEEAARAVAALPCDPDPDLICPTCKSPWRSKIALAEHIYNSHNGPVPEHYLAAERAAGIDLSKPTTMIVPASDLPDPTPASLAMESAIREAVTEAAMPKP